MEDARTSLEDVQTRLLAEADGYSLAAARGRDLGQAVSEYGERIGDRQLSECAGVAALVEEAVSQRLSELALALRTGAHEPMLRLLKGEVAAAGVQLRRYDKVRREFEAADVKFHNLKDGADERKRFTVEKDRNRLAELMHAAWEDTERTYDEAADSHRQGLPSAMIGLVDAYEAFFRQGLADVAALREQLEAHRQASSGGGSARPAEPAGKRGTLWIREGATWSQREAVLKPRYLFVYRGGGSLELKLGIPLHHCCVARDPSDERRCTFLITAKMQSWALRGRDGGGGPRLDPRR